MTELKPCPFCGGKAHIMRTYSNYSFSDDNVHIINTYNVSCEGCKTQGKHYSSDIWQGKDGVIHIDRNGAEDAAEAWNKRDGEQRGSD